MDRQQAYELLLRSLDDELNAAEQVQLKDALERSPELREEKAALLEIRSRIGEQSFSFGPGFAQKVMAGIRTQQKGKVINGDFTKTLCTVFTRVALSGAAAILLLLVYGYLSGSLLSPEAIWNIDKLSSDNLVTFMVHDF